MMDNYGEFWKRNVKVDTWLENFLDLGHFIFGHIDTLFFFGHQDKTKRLINKKIKKVRRGPEIGTKMKYFKLPFCQNFLWRLFKFKRRMNAGC